MVRLLLLGPDFLADLFRLVDQLVPQDREDLVIRQSRSLLWRRFFLIHREPHCFQAFQEIQPLRYHPFLLPVQLAQLDPLALLGLVIQVVLKDQVHRLHHGHPCRQSLL